jgi:hypothetical protein
LPDNDSSVPPRPAHAAAQPAAAAALGGGGGSTGRPSGRNRVWLDNLPASLEGSRLAQKLLAITELDLEELQSMDPPRGYGRD